MPVPEVVHVGVLYVTVDPNPLEEGIHIAQVRAEATDLPGGTDGTAGARGERERRGGWGERKIRARYRDGGMLLETPALQNPLPPGDTRSHLSPAEPKSFSQRLSS